MSTYTDSLEKIQGQVLDGIKQLQATNLEMAANFSKAAGSLLPKAPVLPAGFDAAQYIERTFGFTTQVLDLQKDYLLRMTRALKPADVPNGAAKAGKSA